MVTRVLIVDDDHAVLSGLRRALALEGYAVLTAEDGESGLTTADSEKPDLVVLDVMLPGIDGLTVCQRLRNISSAPILMLSAKDTTTDRVAGLNQGADDYLVKPFALDELLARVRALLRRSQPAEPADYLEFENVVLDLKTREASRGGKTLRLTPREYELLHCFIRHAKQALTREQLCQQVWGYAFEGESNFIDVAVKELRKKLEAERQSRIIHTIRGYGYALRDG